MDENLAREIAAELSVVTTAFNRLSHLTMQIADDAERRSYRKSLGVIMESFDHDLIRPVATKYPHLDPIKL